MSNGSVMSEFKAGSLSSLQTEKFADTEQQNVLSRTNTNGNLAVAIRKHIGL
jgi:hypothetical protein